MTTRHNGHAQECPGSSDPGNSPELPRPGEVVVIDAAAVHVAADPQFANGRSVVLRVVSARPDLRLVGWVWLTGDQLDRSGREFWRREVFAWAPGLKRSA